jgi:hypothetical protein
MASVPLALTSAMFEKLRGATFMLLDEKGQPACCAFFVTPCGVALTAAHEAAKWLQGSEGRADKTVRASMRSGEEFTLSLINEQVDGLDIAVLRINAPPPGSASLPHDFLPLPLEAFSAGELQGAPVVLIHSSIAWSAEARADGVSENRGYIVTSDATRLHYDVSTHKGHSGAALLLRGEAVIGLHSEGFNDLDQSHSETSPSTGADAVRLDLPCVREAVESAKAPAPSGALPAGARRRRR